jgi:hypothetical protein
MEVEWRESESPRSAILERLRRFEKQVRQHAIETGGVRQVDVGLEDRDSRA